MAHVKSPADFSRPCAIRYTLDDEDCRDRLHNRTASQLGPALVANRAAPPRGTWLRQRPPAPARLTVAGTLDHVWCFFVSLCFFLCRHSPCCFVVACVPRHGVIPFLGCASSVPSSNWHQARLPRDLSTTLSTSTFTTTTHPSSACILPLPTTSAIMNGVSRFLSRRDKHGEKRASKHAKSKVRPSSFASTCLLDSPAPAPCCTVRLPSPPRTSPRRRLSAGVQTLYHKLPFVLSHSLGDSLLLLHTSAPGRPLHSPTTIQDPLTPSSDHMSLQSQAQDTPLDLYRIFTSEGPRPPANDHAEKKVRQETRLHALSLTMYRSRCCLPGSTVQA